MLTTWAEANAKMSVCINGAYIPFRDAPDTLHRFVRPALFSTGDEVFELRFFGTSFLVEYRSKRLAISTAHQVNVSKGAPPAEKFVIVVKSEDQHLAVPPTGIHSPVVDETAQQSLEDLTFFEYDHSPSRTLHYDLTNVEWSDSAMVTSDYSFLVGFPSSSTIIELDPDDPTRLSNFKMRWIRQDLEAGTPQLLDTEHRDIFVKHGRSTRDSIDPDGLSGSPVFSIVKNATNERFMRFDGIVTDAKGDRFAVYPSCHIREILEQIVPRQMVKSSTEAQP